MIQMISHGFISAALFLCVGVMYDRLHSRQIHDYGGVVVSMPIFASFMVLFALANSGLPGTSGFVGEFMVILASIKSSFWIALLAATTLVLGAAYSLWLVKRVVFGQITNEQVAEMPDLDRREVVVLGSLAFTVLLFGIWPDPLVEVMHPTIDNLLQHIIVSKI
jgi:NADH-quinone oxidoreductase subunit M